MNTRSNHALCLVLLFSVGVAGGCKPKKSTIEPERGPEPTTDVRDTGSIGSRAEAAYATSVDPVEVCHHLFEMAASEQGIAAPSIDPQMLAECTSELQAEAAVRGTENWNAVAMCILAARGGADLDACDRAHPSPGRAQPPPVSGDTTQEQQSCENMLEVIMAESVAEHGEIPPLTADERAELLGSCVASFVYDEKPNVDPAEYQRLLDCIGAAKSGAQLQACEP